MKLIQTKEYLLLIDEKAEIKQGDYMLGGPGDEAEGLVWKMDDNYVSKEDNKVIAYRPLSKDSKPLDLPELPNPFKEIDSDKEFSLEDMKKAFEAGSMYCATESKIYNRSPDFETFINSLSTQQIPKEFIPEYENRCCGRCDGINDYCISYTPCDYHKVLGCEECFGKTNTLKTTKNSEGKQVLVGKYRY